MSDDGKVRIYCGTKSVIPPTYGRVGTPFECMQCGFGAAMRKYKWSPADPGAPMPQRPLGQEGCRRGVVPNGDIRGRSKRGCDEKKMWSRDEHGRLLSSSSYNVSTYVTTIISWKLQLVIGLIIGFTTTLLTRFKYKHEWGYALLYGLCGFTAFVIAINMLFYIFDTKPDVDRNYIPIEE
jgi:hypothetical protein